MEKIYLKDDKSYLILGNCEKILEEFADNSIDAMVTDPPAFLLNGSGESGFMGKEWDGIKHLWKNLWNNNLFVNFVVTFLQNMQVEQNLEEQNIVQSDAKIKECENRILESVQSAKKNLEYQNAVIKDFAQAIVLTKQEVLDLLKELLPNHIEKDLQINIDMNAYFVIPFLKIIKEMQNIVPKNVVTNIKKQLVEDREIQLGLMDAVRIKNVIEVMIGKKSEKQSINEIIGLAKYAGQDVTVNIKSNVITSKNIDKEDLMKNLTLLLCAFFVIPKQITIPKFLIDNFFQTIFKECLRVLKPGVHALVWAIPKTSHLTTNALENAGFEIRDVVNHIFGSGFPKSLDIGKAVDKMMGMERKVISLKNGERYKYGFSDKAGRSGGIKGKPKSHDNRWETAPATDEAKQWDGWGTALKPACEHWILCRKPLGEKTVAENVLKYGTGGINIDKCRVPTTEIKENNSDYSDKGFWHNAKPNGERRWTGNGTNHLQGRFPSNVITDGSEAVLAGFPNTKSVIRVSKDKDIPKNTYSLGRTGITPRGHNDSGSAARFFKCCPPDEARFIYLPKASKRDRDEGLEGFEEKKGAEMTGRKPGSNGLIRIRTDGTIGENPYAGKSGEARNHHPCVKSTELMRYLCRLITPPGGTVIDPFMGSGSTGKAAILEGFTFYGIDNDKEYVDIAEARINFTITKKGTRQVGLAL